jgi:predicted AlkP superfamily phosphohydrolase/phosphomutase
MKTKKKVLVIGLDGATPELLFPLAKEGKLPNLAKLLNNGVSGNLKSTLPPQTATAWSSFLTGTNPGKHGLFHFLKRLNKYNFTLNNSNDIKATTLWSILNKHGKKVGLMQVPFTYPPPQIDHFVVTGLGTPGPRSDFVYPSKLRDKLLKDLNFRFHNDPNSFRDGNEDNYLKDLYETERKKTEVTLFLMDEYECDFYMVVYMGIDQVQHFFWKYMDKTHPAHNPAKAKKYGNVIEDHYKRIDNYVGDILNNINSDTVVIVLSDHGAGPVLKEVNLNFWLRTKGLQKIKKSNTSEIRRWLLSQGFSIGRISIFLRKIGVLNFLAKTMPERIKEVVPRGDALKEIDWSKTKVFSFGNLGLLYVNLRGREEEGIVEPGREYEELRNYLIEELYKLTDPENGRKIVNKVYKREEIYDGSCTEEAPDLFVLTYPEYKEMMRFLDTLTMKLGKSDHSERSVRISGQHRMNGILIISGKGIQQHKTITNAEIIDIAPTILKLLGIPVPPNMDGKVLADVFSPSFLKKLNVVKCNK